ncbi:MAG: LysR substrate-binding domain-containing protein [Paracoccaceae bacterium]
MRHLRCFMEVARHKSLTAAAQALNTVQPALSRSLKELEDELGHALFHRTAQGMVLTPEGLDFLHNIEGPLTQIQEGIARVKGTNRAQTVRIALAPAATRLLGVGAVAGFQKANPDINLVVDGRSYSDAMSRIRDGSIDFAVGRLIAPRDLGGLSFRELFSEPILFCAHKDHPLAGRESVTLADIDQFTVITPFRAAIVWDEMQRFLLARGRTDLRSVIESSSYEFIRSLMRVTDSIGWLSRSMVLPELNSGEFVKLGIDVDALRGAVGITYPGGSRLSAPARQLFALFVDTASQLKL